MHEQKLIWENCNDLGFCITCSIATQEKQSSPQTYQGIWRYTSENIVYKAKK